MHVEIVAPALLAGSSPARHAALELLLARGRRSRATARSLPQWLAHAFGLGDADLPAGALTALAAGIEPGADPWLRADPVHLQLRRDSLALVPAAGFALSREEEAALAAAVGGHFAADIELHAPFPAGWCLRVRAGEAPQAQAPLALAGKDVNAHLPAGANAARWHALLNEVQMLLHEHPVNAAREVPVNSLWFWGGGRLPASAAGPWHSLTADDPVARGLAQLAKLRHRPLPADAGQWLGQLPEEGRHLLLLDALAAAAALGEGEAHAARLAGLERDWFAPLLAALRAGRIGMVTIHAPEAGLAAETVRGDLRRFWRRARPLAALAA